jgi:transcription antitermination factor NusG
MTDQVENRLRVVRSNGAVRILGTGTTIEPVRDVEIQSIRKLISSGAPFTSVPFLREGEGVRVKRGALEGVEGILTRFKNETRLVISVEMLAQSVSVEVDVRNVEPAGRKSVRRVKAS